MKNVGKKRRNNAENRNTDIIGRKISMMQLLGQSMHWKIINYEAFELLNEVTRIKNRMCEEGMEPEMQMNM